MATDFVGVADDAGLLRPGCSRAPKVTLLLGRAIEGDLAYLWIDAI
jgi:hypothetical protein